MSKLSKYFTLEEATFSQTATRFCIANEPSIQQLQNIESAALQLDEVRDLLRAPVIPSSWLRSLQLNAKVGGAFDSAHLTGAAIDFGAPRFGTSLDICNYILRSSVKYDQLIQEGNWVHISFDSRYRMIPLTAHFSVDPQTGKSRVTYTEGIGVN